MRKMKYLLTYALIMLTFRNLYAPNSFSFGNLECLSNWSIQEDDLTNQAINPLPWINLIPAQDSAYFDSTVRQLADDLGSHPSWLMACFYLESTLDPTAVNPKTDAFGLIQFMPDTRQELGVTRQALMDMEYHQLDVVRRFMMMWKRKYGPLDTITKTYLAIFYPKAIPSSADDTIGGRSVWIQNPCLDTNHDGVLTNSDLTRKLKSILNEKAFD